MTRLIEVLISLAIVAALFLVISFVLPSSRHLSEKVETNRKMTIVYDTLNSVHRFKDWNPLVLHDPRMQLKLSGPESGVGARLDYVPRMRHLVREAGNRDVGTGQERRLRHHRSAVAATTSARLSASGRLAIAGATSKSPSSTTSPMAGTFWAVMPACMSPAMSATT